MQICFCVSLKIFVRLTKGKQKQPKNIATTQNKVIPIFLCDCKRVYNLFSFIKNTSDICYFFEVLETITPVQITNSKARKKPTPTVIACSCGKPLKNDGNIPSHIHSKITTPNAIKMYFQIFFIRLSLLNSHTFSGFYKFFRTTICRKIK